MSTIKDTNGCDYQVGKLYKPGAGQHGKDRWNSSSLEIFSVPDYDTDFKIGRLEERSMFVLLEHRTGAELISSSPLLAGFKILTSDGIVGWVITWVFETLERV